MENNVSSQPSQVSPREEISLSQKIWNLSGLSFDDTRANFLYRRDLHRYFLIGSRGESQNSNIETMMNCGLFTTGQQKITKSINSK